MRGMRGEGEVERFALRVPWLSLDVWEEACFGGELRWWIRGVVLESLNPSPIFSGRGLTVIVLLLWRHVRLEVFAVLFPLLFVLRIIGKQSLSSHNTLQRVSICIFTCAMYVYDRRAYTFLNALIACFSSPQKKELHG